MEKRKRHDVCEVEKAAGHFDRLHSNPFLMRGPQRYALFLKDLSKRGLIQYSKGCLERVGIFFVTRTSSITTDPGVADIHNSVRKGNMPVWLHVFVWVFLR